MVINPATYPIVIRIVQGYIEASQPDLEIYRVRGRFEDLKRPEEIGAIVLDVWKEVMERVRANPALKKPSAPKAAINVERPEVLSPKAVADLLQVSGHTIRRMCEAGQLQAFRTRGKHWKIKITDPTLTRFFPQANS